MATAADRLQEKAIQMIDKHGCLLVFPHQNRPQPLSLWSCLYPKSKMLWEWDEDGDNRVAQLWHLREQLSRSGKVVYSKWHQNRATLMSKQVFVKMLCVLNSSSATRPEEKLILSEASQSILEVLQMDSPQSTRQIKAAVELQGKYLESAYNKAMKPLWNRLLITAWGEFEDSSFPSLGIGATENLFEALWTESKHHRPAQAYKDLVKQLGADSVWIKYLDRLLR